MSYNFTLQMTTITCCRKGCGLTFAVSGTWVERRQEDHSFWYCPNGHNQHFPGESDKERYKRLYEREQERARIERVEALHQKRCAVSARGQVTRVKNRIKNGVCPFCRRTFQNVKRHIQGQHPKECAKK